jgi:hypothetical protein
MYTPSKSGKTSRSMLAGERMLGAREDADSEIVKPDPKEEASSRMGWDMLDFVVNRSLI